MKRIFIVGIARSGTTLLQSIIGNHPEICTFPETHFFSRTIPKQRFLRPLFKVTDQHQEMIQMYFNDLQLNTIYTPYSENKRNVNSWTKYLIGSLDKISAHYQSQNWLEKTPMHLHYTDLIEKNASDTYFIHTIREPISNVAALYDVGIKHPNAFQSSSIEKLCKRYHDEILLSQRCVGKSNHLHIYFEDLINDPETLARSVFHFLDFDFVPEVLNYENTVDRIITKDEIWKSNNSNAVTKSNKVQERISASDIEIIRNKMRSFRPQLLQKYGSN